jgi:hypothetical protein
MWCTVYRTPWRSIFLMRSPASVVITHALVVLSGIHPHGVPQTPNAFRSELIPSPGCGSRNINHERLTRAAD